MAVGKNVYSRSDMQFMIDFLVDNIFVKFRGCLFHQVIGIPMGTNCAPSLVDLFLYSYESEFLDGLDLEVATGDFLGHLIFVTGIY